MSTNIFPYAQLAQKPTEQTWIAWIDEDIERANTTQTFTYRKRGSSDTFISINSERAEIITTGGKYKHEVFIEGLKPGTEYEGVIAGEKTVYFKTVPNRIWRTPFKFCSISDIHVDPKATAGMKTGEDFSEMRERNPFFLLIPGDIITWGNSSTNNNNNAEIAEFWLDFLKDHIQVLNGDNNNLIPLYVVPGNHEVGNSGWNGTGSVNPGDGLLQFFFSNIKTTDIEGTNFGSVTIPRLFQLIGLDTFSALPTTQGEWLEGVIRDDNYMHLTITHLPFFGGGEAYSNDLVHAALCRNNILPHILKNKSRSVMICGHNHLEKRTLPLKLVEEEPTNGNYLSLNGKGFLVEASVEDMDIIEFGEGYPKSTFINILSQWYLESITRGTNIGNNYYYIEITRDEITLEEVGFDNAGTRTNIFTSSKPGWKRLSIMV